MLNLHSTDSSSKPQADATVVAFGAGEALAAAVGEGEVAALVAGDGDVSTSKTPDSGLLLLGVLVALGVGEGEVAPPAAVGVGEVRFLAAAAGAGELAFLASAGDIGEVAFLAAAVGEADDAAAGGVGAATYVMLVEVTVVLEMEPVTLKGLMAVLRPDQ